MFGGMIRDRAGGVIRPGFGREPIGTYRMAREDRARIPKILRALADTFIAAGAKELFIPVLGLPRGLTPDEFRKFDLEHVHGRRLECSSQHPLGTARMASDPNVGVVDPDGKSWDVDELYVVDGSALPTSLGVNPQQTIMSVATRLAWRMRDRPLPQ
jgi:choline dehydrogenase-like flavoprotein